MTHQLAKPKITVWPRDGRRQPIYLDDQCVALEVQKSLQEPEGKWKITLLPAESLVGSGHHVSRLRSLPELYKRIGPGSLVSVGFEERGGMMVGPTTRVDRHRIHARSSPSGQASHALTLSGSDFGKYLSQDGIIHASLSAGETPAFLDKIEAVTGPDHVLLEILPGLWGPRAAGRGPTGVFEGARIQDVVQFVLNTAVSTTLPQLADSLGGSGKPGEYINVDGTVDVWNDGRVWNPGLNDYQGNLWQFIKNLVDEDFYEVLMQTIPIPKRDMPGVSLVIRPKPFDEGALRFAPQREFTGITWDTLRTYVDRLEHHEIDRADLFAEQLGVSDNDMFSYYELTSAYSLIGNDASLQEGLYYPLIDTWALKRHGLRTYKSRITLLAPDVEEKSAGTFAASELHSEVAEFRNRLFNWYRLNEFFEVGTIRVRGRDIYRPGDPVYLPSVRPRLGNEKGLRFYCSGVTHTWSWGDPFVANLQLTRGHNQGVVDAAKALIAADAPPSNPDHYATV